MSKEEKRESRDSLPYPDSDWPPALQRTIKRKLEQGEIDEVDADVFYGNMGRIASRKDDEKELQKHRKM